jgi:hypothetical protein
MLTDHLVGRPITVDVVNLNPDDVAAQLRRMGLPDSSIGCVSGPDAVKQYVDNLENELANAVASQLATLDGESLLIAAVAYGVAARVVGLRRDADVVELEIDGITTVESASSVSRDDRPRKTVSVEQLRQLLPVDGKIRVRYGTDVDSHIVSVHEWNTNIGLGNGRWTVLVPSAMPRPQ